MKHSEKRAFYAGILLFLVFTPILFGASMQIFTTKDGLPENNVTSFAACENKLAVGTDNGVAIYDGKTCLWVPLILPDEIASCPIMDVAFDSGGNLWIASKKGLGQYQPEIKSVQTYDVSDGLPNMDVERLQVFENEVAVGCFGGFIVKALLPAQGGKTRFFPVNYSSQKSLMSVGITGFSLTNSTSGWLSTKGAGLIFLDGGTEQRIDKSQGLASDWVEAFYCFQAPKDGQEQILVGGPQGLSLLRGRNVLQENVFPHPDTWISSLVLGKSVIESEKKSSDVLTNFIGKDNVLWVGTKSSGVWRFNNGEWTNFSSTQSNFPSNCVNRLYRSGTHIAICSTGGLTILSENVLGYDEFRYKGFGIKNYMTFYPMARQSPISQIICNDDLWVTDKACLARYIRKKGLTGDMFQDNLDLSASRESNKKPVEKSKNETQILQTRGKRWELFQKESGNLPVEGVQFIAVDEKQTVWMIVSDSYRRKSLARLRFTSLSITLGKPDYEMIPEDRIPWNLGTELTTLRTEGEDLFIGTRTDGFYILRNCLSATDYSSFEWEHFGSLEKIPMLDIVAFTRPFLPGKKAPLAILHSNALSYWDGKGFSLSPISVDGKFSCITADGAGDLWIGSNNGLFRLSQEGNIFHYNRMNANFESNNITAVIGCQSSSGQSTAIWVACDENPDGSDSAPFILSFNRIEQKVFKKIKLEPLEQQFYDFVVGTGKKFLEYRSDDYGLVESPSEAPASLHFYDGLFWDKYESGGIRCFAVDGNYLWMGTNIRLRRFLLPFVTVNPPLK
ncbi:MAG: hypothetical protein WA705_09240 [Candidatus Ozemobacteraceae bacterium]